LSPRGAKQQRGVVTAERLLDAALAVYAEDPERLSVQAVISRSGVSLGSLYHHFGSLDGLAAALYARCMDELLGALVAALRRTRTARTGIHAVVAAYLDFAAARPHAARFLHASAYAGFLPPRADAVAAAKAPGLDALLAWLDARVRAGEIVPLPPELLEMLIIGPPAETVRRWLAGTPGLSLDEARRVLPARVWASVAAQAP
jgi:AcrR family transcriptional regulator